MVSQHGFHVAGTVTALTEQDSVMCSWMHPTDASMVSNQIARLIDDFEIRGVKIGMLANPEMATAVARSIKRLAEMKVPIVVDPVLRATRGIPLLEGNARQALAPLLALATVVTPNLDELATLTADHVAHDADSMRGAGAPRQAARPARGAGQGRPPRRRHRRRARRRGGRHRRSAAQRIEGVTPHGTGCALSSEIACRLAFGAPLREAVHRRVQSRPRCASPRRAPSARGRPFLGL